MGPAAPGGGRGRGLLARTAAALKSRGFALVLLASAVCFSMYAVTVSKDLVYIVDGGRSAVALVKNNCSTEEILADQQIVLGPCDRVERRQIGALYGELVVTRGISATLTVDGVSRTYSFRGGTVADLLAKRRITLTKDDYCSAAENRILSDGDVVTVNHVDRRIEKKRAVIPFVSSEKSSSLIRTGRRQVLLDGENGLAEETYEELWSGETCVSRTRICSREIIPPTDALILRGQAGVPVSRIDWSERFPIGEDGVPIRYEDFRPGRLATGYSSGKHAYGAGGSYCYYGTVAVHPEAYPYGTKLYIRSRDGRFVYGYALANDTGVLYMPDGRTIDFDLYYETYRESALNSVRTVDVYVLEWGDGRVYK